MKLELYNEIIYFIRSNTNKSRECMILLRKAFPSISQFTLESIYSQEYQRKMKRNHHKNCKLAPNLYERYNAAVEIGKETGIIIHLSHEIDLSPALVARMILEQHYAKSPEHADSQASKSLITKMMKDTTFIMNKDLAYEVYLCIVYDDQYGPIADCIKHSIGQEYELKLQRHAKEKNLTFRDEEQLRERGYDKTPDLKLQVPVAVDNFIINWIESKALFGDEEAHRTYTREQYLSYWNRFGPGLVIYWFGFVDVLEETADKRFIIRQDFPENITHLDPNSILP